LFCAVYIWLFFRKCDFAEFILRTPLILPPRKAHKTTLWLHTSQGEKGESGSGGAEEGEEESAG
jgi:hypothetical protein